MKPREKVIQTHDDSTKTGYLDKRGEFIYHSFDDEPARIFNSGTKIWFKDNNWYRDNHKPAIIYSDGDLEYYKNDKRYWFINGEEYYDGNKVKEKFKNNILYLPRTNLKLLKDNGTV